MKHRLLLFVSLTALAFSTLVAQAQKDFDNGYRFIFYAVLEGCYEDGLATNDISQILLKDEKATNVYSHFVYACPVCTPTIHALEAYQSRPSRFYAMKTEASTFGAGLTAELKKQLYSKKPEDRLEAINVLMRSWVSKRMSLLKLNDQERSELQTKLEEMRKKGMDYLKKFERDKGKSYPISAFENVHQCAVCNGACDMKLTPDANK
jgi:hypothetical protein